VPTSHLYNEQQLFALITKGDERAFRVLYDTYFIRLSAYVFKLCKSASVTEEVLQEVFMKLWVNRSGLGHIEVPEAYIVSIAKNTTISWLRKLARQTNLVADLTALVEEQSNEAEDKMSVSALESLIATALSRLSEQKQKVFHLSKVEGKSHDEIAAELHLSKSTVKNHLSETLKHIRVEIQQSDTPAEILLFLVLLYALQ
jgi:RNA polymerase sigma-70 factor (ECF subfamily)